MGAGALAALGLVSAVMRARSTGVGCDVDVSLFDTALSQLGYVGAWHLTNGYRPERTPDSSHPTQVPSQLLPTRDGWLVVMCAKEKFYRNLVRILGAPELAEDPRFDSFAQRLKHREELAPLLKERTRTRTTAEWLQLLKGQVPCAPVNSVEEALQDPLVQEGRMIIETGHPELGVVRQVAGSIKLSDHSPDHRRGPGLGEHTDQILEDYLEMTPARIGRLREKGVI